MSYSKFNLGIGAKKTTLSVVNKAIGGNIDKSNLNLWYGFISYILYKKNKILVSPQFSLGEIYIRQKDGSKLYGVQKGNHFSIDIKSIFLINKNFKVYSKIGFTEFFLRTKTSKEFENYFNQTHSINLSLGLEF
ncbi:hypothetical protein [Flavobacterium sp.]|uniref:hypothetical protein n=1 Tax=Flavobacterium sp. TaxID=239 RepID=UPI0025BA6F55|nr:hypothetical protein [Flavobacterium sp.]